MTKQKMPYRSRSPQREASNASKRSRSRSPIREAAGHPLVVAKYIEVAGKVLIANDAQSPCRNCVRDQALAAAHMHALVDCPRLDGAMKILAWHSSRTQHQTLKRLEMTQSVDRERYGSVAPCQHTHHVSSRQVELCHLERHEFVTNDKNFMAREIRDMTKNVRDAKCRNCQSLGEPGRMRANPHATLNCPLIEKAKPIIWERYEMWKRAVPFMEKLDHDTLFKCMDYGKDQRVANGDGTERGRDHDWVAQVLNGILQIEMKTRPKSWLEVSLAVEELLQHVLMVEVTEGDPAEGRPLSIPLLRMLQERMGLLRQL